MPAGSVVGLQVDPPDGWQVAPLAPPDLSQAPQIVVLEWSAWGPPGAGARLVKACFAAETGTWTKEAEPLALDKLAQTATSTALRITPDVGALVPTATLGTLAPGHVVSQRLEDHQGALARSFLGFVPDRVVGCFVLCLEATGHAGQCTTSVEGARVHGDFQAPPAESAGLRVVLGAVHHPQAAAGLLLSVAVLGAFVALVTRKTPRRR